MSESAPLVIVKSVNVVFPQWGDAVVTLYVGPAKESVSAMADVTPGVVTDMANLTGRSDGAAVFDHESRAVVAWVPTLDLGSPESVAVLVHELTHVAVFALQRQHIDLGPPDSAQELLAYTVEYLVKLVLQAFAEEQTWYEHRFIAGVLESRGVHYKDKKTRRAARKPGAAGEGVARHTRQGAARQGGDRFMKPWIEKAVKNPGAFPRKAERRGMTPAQLQQAVLANPGSHDTATRRQARLRKTLVGKKVSGK